MFPPSCLLSAFGAPKSFDFHTVTKGDLEEFSVPIEFVVTRTALIHGVSLGLIDPLAMGQALTPARILFRPRLQPEPISTVPRRLRLGRNDPSVGLQRHADAESVVMDDRSGRRSGHWTEPAADAATASGGLECAAVDWPIGSEESLAVSRALCAVRAMGGHSLPPARRRTSSLTWQASPPPPTRATCSEQG